MGHYLRVAIPQPAKEEGKKPFWHALGRANPIPQKNYFMWTCPLIANETIYLFWPDDDDSYLRISVPIPNRKNPDGKPFWFQLGRANRIHGKDYFMWTHPLYSESIFFFVEEDDDKPKDPWGRDD